MASKIETKVKVEKVRTLCMCCSEVNDCYRIKFGSNTKIVDLCEKCYAGLKMALADDGNKPMLFRQGKGGKSKTGVRHYTIQEQIKGKSVCYVHRVDIRVDNTRYRVYCNVAKTGGIDPEAVDIATRLNELVVIYRYNGNKVPLMEFIEENSKALTNS